MTQAVNASSSAPFDDPLSVSGQPTHRSSDTSGSAIDARENRAERTGSVSESISTRHYFDLKAIQAGLQGSSLSQPVAARATPIAPSVSADNDAADAESLFPQHAEEADADDEQPGTMTPKSVYSYAASRSPRLNHRELGTAATPLGPSSSHRHQFDLSRPSSPTLELGRTPLPLASLWHRAQESASAEAKTGCEEDQVETASAPLSDLDLAELHSLGNEALERFVANYAADHSSTIRSRPTKPSAAHPSAIQSEPTSPSIHLQASQESGQPQPPPAYELYRELSKALWRSRAQVDVLAKELETERRAYEAKFDYHKRLSEVKEEAMRAICSQHGISLGVVDRAVSRAVADMPQVRINAARDSRLSNGLVAARDSKHPSRSGSADTRAAPTTSVSGGSGPTLPFSLQEAMADALGRQPSRSDLSDAETGSRKPTRSPSLSSSKYSAPVSRTSTTSSPSNLPTARHTPRAPSSPGCSGFSGSSIGASSRRAMSGRRSSSKTAEGLMAWRSESSDRKSAPTTQETSSASIQADGYLSDSAAPDASEADADESLGSVLDQAESGPLSSRKVSASTIATSVSPDDGGAERRNNAMKAPRSGGFGFFSSLTWREKKSADSAPTLQKRGQDDAAARRASSSKRPLSMWWSSPQSAVAPSARERPAIAAVHRIERTVSGGDVISALHDAIGSAPVSPSERPAHTIDISSLPKPSHVKAIFLATRIMSPDPASLLGARTPSISPLVSKLALNLVGNARSAGLDIDVTTKRQAVTRSYINDCPQTPRPTTTRRPSGQADATPKQRPPSMAIQAATAVMDATMRAEPRPVARRSPSSRQIEPNVTRVPSYFGLGGSGPSSTSHTPLATAPTAAQTDTKEAPPGSLAPVELVPVVPLKGKPPTLSFQASHAKSAGAVSRRNGHLTSLQEQDDNSGDEFEVYGGKVQQPSVDTEEGSTFISDQRAVDVFGFVYDASPADVRLLREAKKASTPAPACLTGVRVGVSLKSSGADCSDDDRRSAASDDDEADAETDTDADGENATPLSKKSSSQSIREQALNDSVIEATAPNTAGNSGKRRRNRLQDISHAEPSTGSTSLLAQSASAQAPGPTSPEEERKSFKLHDAIDGKQDDVKTVPRPKAISETVKSLLDQLKVMHSAHQAEQAVRWDAFISRRRQALTTAAAMPSDGKGERLRHPARQAFSPSQASRDEQYHFDLLGVRQMGDDKVGKEDRKQLLQLCQTGIPLARRPRVWSECSGADEIAEPGLYQELLDEHRGETNQCLDQIDLDIHRTMPTNIFFGGGGPGVAKLRRVLVAYSWYSPDIGYCQGMNNLAATLLLTHASEEEAFWVLVCIIEKILPAEYYTSHLLVSQADQRVLIDLVRDVLPDLATHIDDLGVDLPAITFAWFLSLYTDCLPVETLFRVWDLLFIEGSILLFRVAVAILIMNQRELLATNSVAEFYGHVHSMTSRLFCVDKLVQIACQDLRIAINEDKIAARRQAHVRDLRGELGLTEDDGR
ncbi:unnamed protein product [Parajaminaea phylloscopi]